MLRYLYKGTAVPWGRLAILEVEISENNLAIEATRDKTIRLVPHRGVLADACVRPAIQKTKPLANSCLHGIKGAAFAN